MQKLNGDKWDECVESDLSVGDTYRTPLGGKLVGGVLVGNGWHQQQYHPVSEEDKKKATEREWQESELLRTDNWPSDRPPGTVVMLAYRVELRDYNNQPEFPNGTRPTL